MNKIFIGFMLRSDKTVQHHRRIRTNSTVLTKSSIISVS